ncbi:MAG TPA: SLC13 family permease [Candidatus Krumholzibacteria bacterium]|nr:SLC13 family permease [Candidatus Krumholzibacteria bacterium]
MAGALLIFSLTYALIAARRVGLVRIARAAATTAGAAACVLAGILAPEQAYASIDGDTLILLLAMMLLAAHLDQAGFFEWGAAMALRLARTPQRLLTVLVFSTGLLSAFLVNDAVCFLMAPLLVRVVRRLQLGSTLFLMALATSANIGSVMTIVGNPQTMIAGSLGKLSFSGYFACMAPLGLFCLALNRVLLPRFYPLQRRVPPAWARQADSLEAPFDDADELPHELRRTVAAQLERGLLLKCLLCLLAALIGFFAGLNVAWCALGAAAILLLLVSDDPRSTLRQVDWQLLLFVVGLFVVVGALRSRDASGAMLEALRPWLGQSPERQSWALALLTLVGSNVVGNIPFVLAASEWMPQWSDPHLGWMILAMASTFAGNLFLVSSVANGLVRDASAEISRLRFRDHMRYGVVITLLSTGIGTLWLLLVL